MSSITATNLSVSGNASIGVGTSTHQVNGNVVFYNNPLTLNNSTITQTGNSSSNTISQPTTFTSDITVNGKITNASNIITIGNLTLSFGYKAGIATSNYLTYDLQNNQTHYFWDSVEVANQLICDSGISNTGTFIQNGISNLYSVLNLLATNLQNSNCINFNNSNGGNYSIQQIDSGANYLRIGRTGNSDITINSDGSTSFNNNIFLIPTNGVYSLYFGVQSTNQIGRLFAVSSQMYFDFYNAFTFRYFSSKDGVTGLSSMLTINSSGISTPSTMSSNAVNTNYVTCNNISYNYVNVPGLNSSNLGYTIPNLYYAQNTYYLPGWSAGVPFTLPVGIWLLIINWVFTPGSSGCGYIMGISTTTGVADASYSVGGVANALNNVYANGTFYYKANTATNLYLNYYVSGGSSFYMLSGSLNCVRIA